MSTILTTGRLTMRPLGQDDLPELVPLLNDYEVAKNLTNVSYPYNAELGRRWISVIDAKRARGDGETWGIAHDRTFIGVCAIDRTEGRLNLGYWLGKPFWRQGYATEAAGRAVRFVFEELGEAALISGYYEDNPASGRVLAKLGFEPAGFDLVHSLARNATVVNNRVWLEAQNFCARKAA